MFKSENDDVARKHKAGDGLSRGKKKPQLQAKVQPHEPVSLSAKPSPTRSRLPLRLTDTQTGGGNRTGIANENLEAFSPSYGLSSDVEGQAISFMFSHYIIASTSDNIQGYFEYLPDLVAKGRVGDLVETCVVAVGLAGLANVLHCKPMMRKARKTYGSALQRTNLALQTAETAKNDETLVAILLLSKFELVTFEVEGSKESWKKHIDGASLLLRLRGQAQVRNWLGLRLFMQLNGNILTNCMGHDLPVPEIALELRGQLQNIIGQHTQMFRITGLMIEFIHTFRTLKAQKASKSEAIPVLACLDQEAQAVSESMPHRFHYGIFYTNAHSELAYNGYYHEYRDVWGARNWNVLRGLRLAVNVVIRRYILFSREPSSSDLYSEQLKRSTDVMVQMANDICATVPQHAGYLHLLSVQNAEHRKTSIRAMGRQAATSELEKLFDTLESLNDLLPAGHRDNYTGAVPAASCIHLISPLRMAGRMSLASVEMRAWIARRLRWIAETLGVRQAAVFAEDVEETVLHGEHCLRLMQQEGQTVESAYK